MSSRGATDDRKFFSMPERVKGFPFTETSPRLTASNRSFRLMPTVRLRIWEASTFISSTSLRSAANPLSR